MGGQEYMLVAVGLVACFMGYTVFRGMLPLWGFIIGAWITYLLMPLILGARAGDTLILVAGVVVGGVIGALLAVPLYFVIVFLSGGALGILIGVMIGSIIDAGGVNSIQKINAFISNSFPPFPHTPAQLVLAAIFLLIMGVLAISFQKFMISASSAFLGSAALISGLVGPITAISQNDVGRGAVMILAWMILALAGLFVQFRLTGEV